MKKVARKVLAGLAFGAMLLPAGAFAAEKNISDWLTIGGDYRFRVDSLRAETGAYVNFQDPAFQQWIGGVMTGVVDPNTTPPPASAFKGARKDKNESVYTNRFGLNLKAKVMNNVTFNSRLLMYKDFGSQTGDATLGPYFADRSQQMDGTAGHVPGDGQLTVDQAYVTINNIFDQPVWFSVGRRPSTGGLPTHLRQNGDKPGVGGVAGILVDYAYDGMTLGWAPDIDALPGAYAKLCYGRGFQTGYHNATNSVKNMDMAGVVVVPYDTDKLSVHLQVNRGMNIIDNPNGASVNMGDIDQYGATVMSTLKMGGESRVNLFGSVAMSQSHPNDMTASGNQSPFGLMYTATAFGGSGKESKTGEAIYLGARVDLPSKTKIGFEFNHGTKNWIGFLPAADDMITSKLGTRGNVYEGYVIQELPYAPIASEKAKTFFKVGYQYYKFEYTGSNNWVGGAEKISDVSGTNPFNAQMFAPVKNAQDLYATLEVKF
jgi:hypothetical protein